MRGRFQVIVVMGIAHAFAAPSCSLAGLPQREGDSPSTQEHHSVKPNDQPKHTNRLIRATSPYLLQHAHNPVDWHEWSDEALAQARSEDKPIFLSIGYAACHWCHVMEHDSFEHEDVAAVLNKSFVSIKVDREERPDIDEIYMAYTQARTGHGGWPMSVWLTPQGVPFYAGTYFPKDQFKSVLQQIGEMWSTRREEILKGADGAQDFFGQWSSGPQPAADVPARSEIENAATSLARVFDRSRGGMSGGGSNKFPPSMAMELMLRVYRLTGDRNLLEAVEITLDHMARGGIYDQVGGGICRYSTDPEWLVPHFEKMLYDQALVSSVYLDAYLVTKKQAYADVAKDIFEYVIADLQAPEGGLYSSRDADSDGLEGAFYIWTLEHVRDALGEEEARLACAYYDVTESGNWFERMGHAPKGPKNILHVSKPPEVFAKLYSMTADELQRRVTGWREKLRAARARRTHPGLDDKILTGWNGLMIAALAKGARVLDEPRFARAASQAADCILTKLRKDGRLLRTYRKDEARLTGYLEDYAFFIEGLLNLYEATFDRRWLNEAVALTEGSIEFYYDQANGGFFFTASDAEKLVARTKSPNDSAIPSGNSVHALNLLRLAVLLDRKDYRAKAEATFRCFARQVVQSPYSFERHLCALDFYHDRVKEIAIIGDPASPDTAALIRVVYGLYLPNKVVTFAPDKREDEGLPLLMGKGRKGGESTAYVCERYTCKSPSTTPQDLARQLDAKP